MYLSFVVSVLPTFSIAFLASNGLGFVGQEKREFLSIMFFPIVDKMERDDV